MKQLIIAGMIAATSTNILAYTNPGMPVGSHVGYRLYNKNTGEHFYTASDNEKNHLIRVGWTYEGSGWQAMDQGDPVYRVYNPNAKGGDHYYTKNQQEAEHLVGLGWKWDNDGNPVFASAGNLDLFVAYNPNAQSGAHNYTTSENEQNFLTRSGWIFPEVAWNVAGKGIQEGHPGDSCKVDVDWTGPGGSEAQIKGSYRLQISNRPFDYTDLDGEVPVISFSGDFSMNGHGKEIYENEFIIGGNGKPGNGQIGISLRYMKGNDSRYRQGVINTTVVNFPADSDIHGQQYYAVYTPAPAIKDDQKVHLEVNYYEKGWMTAFVDGRLVGMFKTKLVTSDRYILHNDCGILDYKLENLKVEKNGVDVTNQGAPNFVTVNEGHIVQGAY